MNLLTLAKKVNFKEVQVNGRLTVLLLFTDKRHFKYKLIIIRKFFFLASKIFSF